MVWEDPDQKKNVLWRAYNRPGAVVEYQGEERPRPILRQAVAQATPKTDPAQEG